MRCAAVTRPHTMSARDAVRNESILPRALFADANVTELGTLDDLSVATDALRHFVPFQRFDLH